MNNTVSEQEEIGINIASLLAVLRRAKSNEKVTLEFTKGANRLLVTIKGASTRKFTIPVLDIEKGEVPEMKLDFPASIEAKTSVLADGIDDASIVTDTVILGASPKEFTMHAEGDMSKVEINLEKGAPDLLSIEAKDASHVKILARIPEKDCQQPRKSRTPVKLESRERLSDEGCLQAGRQDADFIYSRSKGLRIK